MSSWSAPASDESSTNRSNEDTLAFAIDAVTPILGGATVVEPQLKRWRYATPTVLHPVADALLG